MYTHLFSVSFQKLRHGGHICFLTPMITLCWPISRKLCTIGGQRAVTWNPLQIRPNLLLMMDRKSYGLSFGDFCIDLE